MGRWLGAREGGRGAGWEQGSGNSPWGSQESPGPGTPGCLVVVSARRRCSTPAGVAPEGSESAGDSRRVGKSPGQGVQLARGRGTRGRGSITCSLSSSAISSDRRRGRCWEMESGGTGPVPEATRGPEVIREELGSRRTSRSVLVHLRWSLPWRSFFASGRRLPVLWTHSVSFFGQLFRPALPPSSP